MVGVTLSAEHISEERVDQCEQALVRQFAGLHYRLGRMGLFRFTLSAGRNKTKLPRGFFRRGGRGDRALSTYCSADRGMRANDLSRAM